MEKYKTEGSKKLYEELNRVLLDGVASSFHKASYEEYPIAMERAKGPYMYDVDGNEYIDYINGLGPMILGYASDYLNDAVKAQLEKGTHFSTPTRELLELVKKLVKDIPCAEMVSFQNSGTEANLFAFRVARAYTGKDKIVKFEGQYHGWADEEKITIDAENVAQLGQLKYPNKIIHNPGQPRESTDNIIVLPWNDEEILEELLRERDDIAGVIMEPFMCDSGPINPKDGYLKRVRELTSKYNVVLIFDEVITGFHMALGGAQEYYDVVPDVATFAKAMSGGYPIAAICGKKEIMKCGVHASGTFNGNALGVAAALATLKKLEDPEIYKRFDELGERLNQGILEAAAEYEIPVYVDHAGAICTMLFGVKDPVEDFRDCLENLDYEFYIKVAQLSKEYGLRLTPKRGRMYLSTEHTEKEIDKTVAILKQVFAELSGRKG